MDDNKENDLLMPESVGKAICIKVAGPVTAEGYQKVFLPRMHEVIDKYGEFNLLAYYEDYQGWEEDAVEDEMKTVLQYGKYFAKIAMVNPPQKEMFRIKYNDPLFKGEVRMFSEDQLAEAIAWVQQD